MLVNIDGINILNCTPHEIRFQNKAGEVITVEKSGYTLPAQAVEEIVVKADNLTLVATAFKATEKGISELDCIHEAYPLGEDPLIIVGSIISAQAYPGFVKALVPVPGTERAAPTDKIYLANKFTVYE